MNPTKTHRIHQSNDGFALVATLTLMVLLAILALGLLTLSSIALRTASQGDSVAIARANARLALMMAIGELQREMGPDSRISAPHDAGTLAPGGQPHWTAVYDAWQRPADPSKPESPGDRTPTFRGWLVSGANQANGGPTGTGDEVTLVGPGSLGDGAAPEDEIRVPMQTVSQGSQKGRIAWWTSDEGLKAKINAGADPAGGNPVASNPLFDAQSPPHVGHQAIEILKDFEWAAKQRSMAVSTGIVNLPAGLSSPGLGSLNHDVTVHSAGVLADVRAGRLKRDLSSLLSRPVEELENKPLYLADGRMNRFEITESGDISNAANISSNSGGANRWGINLEELYLFHNIHREVDWSTGQPRLVTKSSKEEIVQDRFYIYRKPSYEAVHLIVSFKAVPDSAPDKYKMQGMLDAMVAFSNPNDIPLVWTSDTSLSLSLQGLPYKVKWNIRKADGSPKHTHTTGTMNTFFFKCSVDDGFTLEPGEAGVFGNSTADTQARQSNLTRGFIPRGGVEIADDDWQDSRYSPPGLRAGNLDKDDKIDLTMLATERTDQGTTGSGWVQCVLRIASGGSAWRTGQKQLKGGGDRLRDEPINKYMLNDIEVPQALDTELFIDDPKPVMMMTFMPNVEQSRGLQPPNAFASRPFQLIEPAVVDRVINTQDLEADMHETQWIAITDPMNYEFGNDRTLAAGDGGRSLYHGGAREVGLGGNFNVVKRRIPLTTPLSIGAFENAIACGFVKRHKNEFSTPEGDAFSGNGPASPGIAKAIGNSWATPFLSSDKVFDGVTDPSWMANTALWDSWFLSGIVDGGATPSSSWGQDSRNQREQFRQFAEGVARLRNMRFSYNPHQSIPEALEELFDGDVLKSSAINGLPKYLLVDGAFNVNSTSEQAWEAFLTSVRDQELLDANGASQKKDHPFGTLGYAVSQATSGTEGDWKGFRDLGDSEMTALASAIVGEVKSRGPFLSMADFVNRRPNSTNAEFRALGALQAAIDKSGLNDRFTVNGRQLDPGDIQQLAGKDTLQAEPAPARAIGAAGYLSQAALLTAFGPQITVRGDTFVIRAYGDHRDASGKISAKSWCEAVVQRFPKYVDSANPPEASGSLSSTNATFGRKFKIVSFRWLNPSEV